MGPLIFSIETCTLAGSLALVRGDETLASSSGDPGSSHSNTLLKEIDQLLASTNIQLRDVDLFAVAVGPGSFTGLRIGIATVKALAATLHKPVAAIPTLEAIALSAGPSTNTVALLPAGRGEVFSQHFSISEDHIVTSLDAAAHLSPSRMLERYSHLTQLVWAGPGAHAQQELIRQLANELSIELAIGPSVEESSPHEKSWRIAPISENLANYCAALALQKYRHNQVEQAHELKAVYVRPSDAELKTA
jgi:tRNA threonylcarbamoyladenosine biosynthesis protein TsaB